MYHVDAQPVLINDSSINSIGTYSSITQVLADSGFSIVDKYIESPHPACFSPIPESVIFRLRKMLIREYPAGIYRHQALVMEKALTGENVVISTGTASGKSLAFMMPVFQSILHDPTRCAIFVYPLKALCADQMEKMRQLAHQMGPAIKVARFDGSIGKEERELILKTANVLAVTPDVLHTTLLRRNQESDYDRIFRHLDWVVLDECHV